MIEDDTNTEIQTSPESLAGFLGFGDVVVNTARNGGERSVIVDIPRDAQVVGLNVFPILSEEEGNEKLGFGGTTLTSALVKAAGDEPWSVDKVARASVRGMGFGEDPEMIAQFTQQLAIEAAKEPIPTFGSGTSSTV